MLYKCHSYSQFQVRRKYKKFLISGCTLNERLQKIAKKSNYLIPNVNIKETGVYILSVILTK